jgi:hypothetical protein
MTTSQSARALPEAARVGLLLTTLAGLAVLAYPRPRLLARTLRHAWRPDIDAAAVDELAAGLSDDPDAIRAEVLSAIVPHERDWAVFGVPYYFPTLQEALENGRGDCKSQVLVLASLLSAKGIPYRLLASLDHVWAEYSGKTPTAMEDPAVAVAEYRDGRWRPLRPARLRPRAHLETSLDEYWRGATRGRRLLFAGALLLLVALTVGRAARAEPAEPLAGSGPGAAPTA